jgi:hypothetical protein
LRGELLGRERVRRCLCESELAGVSARSDIVRPDIGRWDLLVDLLGCQVPLDGVSQFVAGPVVASGHVLRPDERRADFPVDLSSRCTSLRPVIESEPFSAALALVGAFDPFEIAWTDIDRRLLVDIADN